MREGANPKYAKNVCVAAPTTSTTSTTSTTTTTTTTTSFGYNGFVSQKLVNAE